MSNRGLVSRLTVTVGVLTSSIVLIAALAIAALVYIQAELQFKNDLSRAAFAIIREELEGRNGQINLQKTDDGQSLATMLRNLDLSLYIADATGSAVASYGIYRILGQQDLAMLLAGLSPKRLDGAVYRDRKLSRIGQVDTYTIPLREGAQTVGMMQLTRVNNFWPIIGKSLFFSLIMILPLIWFLAVLVIRWGTKLTLSPLSELVTSVALLDVERLPEDLPKPHAMDADVGLLHRTLQVLIRRIRASMTRQREISENLSHEFKTPLTRIASRLGVLSDRMPEQKHVLEPAIREVVDLGEQVDGLLDVAMYDATAHHDTYVRLKELVKEITGRFSDRDHGVDIHIPDSFRIRIPQGHARILLGNLLDNAMKHSAPKGTVRVTARGADGRWTLSVLNTVDPATVTRADVFVRKYRGTTATSRGYGLGLAIVHDVAKQLDLDVRYTVDGDVVTVTISGSYDRTRG